MHSAKALRTLAVLVRYFKAFTLHNAPNSFPLYILRKAQPYLYKAMALTLILIPLMIISKSLTSIINLSTLTTAYSEKGPLFIALFETELCHQTVCYIIIYVLLYSVK